MHTKQQQTIGTQARERFSALTANLTALLGSPDIIGLIDRFIASFDDLPAYAGYKHIPPVANQLNRQMQQRLGTPATHDFLYACILKAISRTLDSVAFARLPIRVKGHQLKQFSRIVSEPSGVIQSSEMDNDLFHKDLGLALMRLYAAAAQLVDYRAGVGRILLTKGGLMDMPRRLAIFANVGGFKPFFEIHTHLSYLDEFNEEGWNECYRCCVDLYVLHPKVLGMHGGSWFYDPALDKISPRLGYLREIPQKGGAYVLFDSINEQSTQDAISTSPTRKKLYTEGAYQPQSHALIWPRAAQINWAKNNQGIG